MISTGVAENSCPGLKAMQHLTLNQTLQMPIWLNRELEKGSLAIALWWLHVHVLLLIVSSVIVLSCSYVMKVPLQKETEVKVYHSIYPPFESCWGSNNTPNEDCKSL